MTTTESNGRKKAQEAQRSASTQAVEGVWYVAKDTDGWKLFAYPFRPESEIQDHSAFWEQILAPYLALKYKLPKKLEMELALYPYGFPRGRISKVEGKFFVYHGADWHPFPAQAEVAKAFHLSKRAMWVFDDHETRLEWDVERVSRSLNLKTNMPP